MNHFCTITTASHIYKVLALADSLNRQHRSFVLHVLVVDESNNYTFENCKFWSLADMHHNESARTINAKYKGYKDRLRWSMKPVFIKYLLTLEGIEKVIYLDNDLFFYSDYQFLFDYLNDYSFLLTPHYYKINPKNDQNWLEANFRVGLFNAGFVGANRNALPNLQWWADSCAYRCEKNAFRGLYDDQKYLDLMPVIEKNSFIVRHKGCNVAGWNTDLCPREVVGYQVLIEGVFPIVFIHFANTTIREIINGNDKILFNYYHEYVTTLKKYKEDLAEKELLFDQLWIDKFKFNLWKIITEFGI